MHHICIRSALARSRPSWSSPLHPCACQLAARSRPIHLPPACSTPPPAGSPSSSHMLGLMWGQWVVVDIGSCSLRALAASSQASRDAWSRESCQSRPSILMPSAYLLTTRKGRTCTPKEPLAMVSVASQASAWRLRSGLRVGLPRKSTAGRGFASAPTWAEHCSDPSAAMLSGKGASAG